MNKPLWSPSEERASQSLMHTFQNFVSASTGLKFASYRDFHSWSVQDINRFWDLTAQFVGIKWQTSPDEAFVRGLTMRDVRWFPGGTLNFAANLLPNPASDEMVLVSHGEGLPRREYSARGIWNAVARCADALKERGVGPGDRVAGVLANGPEAIIAMLATASLGGVWASCSPDFGNTGVYDRLSQIGAKVVFVTKHYRYQGKLIDAGQNIFPAVERLASVPQMIVCDPYADYGGDEFSSICFPRSSSPQSEIKILPIEFQERGFCDPLYIMFSSGTTGLPKCIVHGVGGTLLQHKKELMLHSDLRVTDRMMFFTTCGWMMWNWMVTSLSCGARVITFDGSPTYPTFERLWDLAREEGVTHFGTSPKFIASCMATSDGIPYKNGPLPKMRCVLSTGSPLLPAHFEWIYRVLPDVHLASISGGTDIISCFMLGNPALPVYPSEIQCAGLGMAIEAWDEHCKPVQGEKGELVCVQPFVSMPVGFWNDTTGEKYKKAYFDHYPDRDVWRHGDFVEMTEHDGVIVYGRSDATLNPGGVRIGTAEIYRAVESLPFVSDSIAVGQNWQGDTRILLFVKMRPGEAWCEDHVKTVKQKIRQELTPRHVPAVVLPIADIPYTRSGKKVEIAATQVIHGEDVPNRAALINPESLDLFAAVRPRLVEPSV